MSKKMTFYTKLWRAKSYSWKVIIAELKESIISLYYVVGYGSDCDGLWSSRIYEFATENEAEIFQKEQSIASDGLRFTTCKSLKEANKYLWHIGLK